MCMWSNKDVLVTWHSNAWLLVMSGYILTHLLEEMWSKSVAEILASLKKLEARVPQKINPLVFFL